MAWVILSVAVFVLVYQRKVKIPKHIKINFVDLTGFKSASSGRCPNLNGHRCPAEGMTIGHWFLPTGCRSLANARIVAVNHDFFFF